MYRALCDQVDIVRYLIAWDTRWLPSTRSTSPGRIVALSFADVVVGEVLVALPRPGQTAEKPSGDGAAHPDLLCAFGAQGCRL